MTENVRHLLEENNILLQKVPANLTYLLQSLDVQGSSKGYAKKLTKEKFMLWCAYQVTSALENGTPIDQILSILKPLHAKWMIEYIMI